VAISPSTARPEQVDCPSGKKARGGGASTTDISTKRSSSTPTDAGTGWVALFHNTGAITSATGYAWVICANVTS
jgi:hypothetical protein